MLKKAQFDFIKHAQNINADKRGVKIRAISADIDFRMSHLLLMNVRIKRFIQN